MGANTRKSVLLICGSLRKKSLNRQVGTYVEELLHEAADTAWLEYASLPFMNQDVEFPVLPEVQRVRNAIIEADAVWIFSPEYNHGIPGVLKNCLDWLSRPMKSGSTETAIRGKLTAFSCAGGGAKARYCAADLAETLSFMQADLIETTHTQIALDRKEYTTDVLALSQAEKETLQTQANIFIEHLAKLD